MKMGTLMRFRRVYKYLAQFLKLISRRVFFVRVLGNRGDPYTLKITEIFLFTLERIPCFLRGPPRRAETRLGQ